MEEERETGEPLVPWAWLGGAASRRKRHTGNREQPTVSEKEGRQGQCLSALLPQTSWEALWKMGSPQIVPEADH